MTFKQWLEWKEEVREVRKTIFLCYYFTILVLALCAFTISKYEELTYQAWANHPFVITVCLLIAIPGYMKLSIKVD